MEYKHIKKGIFVSRPNRFIATVRLDGADVTCHVKNTGRCRELLIPGAKVLLEYHPDAKALNRKTEYSLICVYKSAERLPESQLLINMDSQAPNQAAFEWLVKQEGVKEVRREVSCKNSRFDLSFSLSGDFPQPPASLPKQNEGFNWRQAYMEVKGVTLEENGIARFPDAPTLRGLKHVDELAELAREGVPCFILFVIQMKHISCFEPNMQMQPEFGLALSRASAAGVKILAYDCRITESSMDIDEPVPVRLPELP